MQRYFLEVSYNGNAFHGSQLQGETPTVQLAINNALTILLRTPTGSFGASRTDEGVHALCNYFHFDTEQELHPHFLYKMNSVLPPTVAVQNIYKPNTNELNARFNAIRRRYRYRIYFKKNPFLLHKAYYFPFRIDKNILKESAQIIKEYDHFESFSKRNTQSKTFICTIHQSYWEDHGDELHYVVEANRFLRGMVRALTGTQLQIARGKINLEKFRQIIEMKDCRKADFSVEGYGLYLENISYPEGLLTALELG